MQSLKLAFIAASCLVTGSAAAQPVPEAAPPRTTEPVLPGVMSTSVGMILDGRIDYTSFEDEGERLALGLRGQYIAAAGLGGYVAIPFASEQGESGLGNLELGAMGVLRSGNLDTYARAGVTLALTDDQTNPTSGAILVPRPTDAFSAGGTRNWVRGGGGVRLTSRAVVLAGAAGVDVPIEGDGIDGVIHLTGSIGVVERWFGFAGGVTVMRAIETGDLPIDRTYVDLQVVGDVPVGTRVRIYGALCVLVVSDQTAVSLGAGLRVHL